MVTRTRLRLCLLGMAVVCMATVAVWPGNGNLQVLQAAEPTPPNEAKSWSFMNGNILQDIIGSELEDANKSMRSRGTFFRGYRKVEVTGYMVAVLGNVGTMIFKEEDAKKAAALREAGLALAEASAKRDFAGAEKAIAAIKQYPKQIKPAEDGSPVKFEELVELGALMKGVSRIDTDTGAIVKKIGSDFDKSAKMMAAQSYLMACLGVASRVHNDAEDWQKWCDEMREGSIRLAEQFAKKDQPGAQTARAELQKSCAECHEVYREEL